MRQVDCRRGNQTIGVLDEHICVSRMATMKFYAGTWLSHGDVYRQMTIGKYYCIHRFDCVTSYRRWSGPAKAKQRYF